MPVGPFYPYLGIIVGVAGSVAINMGNNLQSLGMQQLEEESWRNGEEGPVSRPPSDSKTWVIGTVVFVSGSLLNFGSYSLAPQSLLASLEAIQVLNIDIMLNAALIQ